MDQNTFEERVNLAINRQGWLDEVGETMQNGMRAIFDRLGGAGAKFADLLHGTWLGHPLHPVITDVVIGSYTTAIALDILENATEQPALGKGADAALGLGVTSALGAAASGLADWQYASGETRRYGLVHALLNSTALVLYIASLVFRRSGKRSTGKSLSLIGYALSVGAAYLGGDLVFRQKMGTNHAPVERTPRDFVDVASIDELPEGSMRKVMAGKVPILLARQNGQISAIAETCAHMGGPLSKGELLPEGAVVCPWHQSTFELSTGRVLKGPSAFPQPCYEVRVDGNRIMVRNSSARELPQGAS